ncbi:6-phosphogluconolactonase [Candidatus Synechococcus calcipolaris G9]|uniref:6-phosphogluconolactonase n=1 Tax=Candidatus Synechococcus calcipolaris G9 TaxID=1497997 RepID=A0ABT6EWW8_9SYNE|nr:6-phosphogluconolactonase [Candidatus Synechococcus calcipolaris]MDG2990282.1 6-phosphogluconolactonase [Candidatus Synechococcus calcipolaris G9]
MANKLRHIEVLPDLETLCQRALDITLECLTAAINERDQFTIALAGGSTPTGLYEKLSKESLPWDKFQVFWGDERYVPLAHPDSNAGKAKQVWLDLVPIPSQNIHITPTHLKEPVAAAAAYEETLQRVFQTHGGEIPQFDLILLGMGPDGHTASLFPHTPALQVSDRLVTVGKKDDQPRITFTVPLINHAKTVLFLVSGSNKQQALSHVFNRTGDPQTYPTRLIEPEQSLIWLLDQEAGLGVTPPES